MAAAEDLETLLARLDEVDEQLRALYRSLAENPDSAEAQESLLRDLSVQRRELAQRVGLAALFQHRARRTAIAPDAVAVDRGEPAPSEPDQVACTEGPSDVAAVTAEIIDDWKRSASSTGLGRAAYEDRIPVTWGLTLDKLMSRVGPPRNLEIDLSDELDALDVVGQDPFISDWAALPRHVQQLWLGMLVARTRAVKDVSGVPASQRARVKSIISRYPGWAADYQPGHVHGLRLDHKPVDGAWSVDATRLWGELGALIEDERPLSKPGTPRKKRADSDSGAAAETTERPIDPAWPLWSLVRGQRALIVGGDPREANRRRLEQTFQFASLDWPDIGGPRRVDAVVARIKKRGVDLVLLLTGFIDHKQSEPIVAAAKESGVLWSLSDGYGVASVRGGLERFLGASTGT